MSEIKPYCLDYGPVIRQRRFRFLHMRYEWGQYVYQEGTWGVPWYWDLDLFEWQKPAWWP